MSSLAIVVSICLFLAIKERVLELNSQRSHSDDLPGLTGALHRAPMLADAVADVQSHSRFKDVQNPAIAIYQTMALAARSSPLLGRTVGAGFLMGCLVVLPLAVLVLPLDVDGDHG